MKCPKCNYLGFETGDRCKNCGYDFSLASAAGAAAAEPDLPLREPESLAAPSLPAWLDHLDRNDPVRNAAAQPVVAEAVPAAARAPRPRLVDSSLPLFGPAGDDDDAPLIKLPATPRPPLAVRRTPETPRLRAVPKPRRTGAGALQNVAEPSLALFDEPAAPEPKERETSGPGRRLAAAAIDHAILLAVDASVIYFTLRLAAMTMPEWRLLPAVPMLVFLGMVKAAYFCAFTTVGGQTIGKMAARIRVVTDDNAVLDPARAMRRTAAGAVSLLTLGLGFLPALVTTDRRALHDRLAGTRVIALE